MDVSTPRLKTKGDVTQRGRRVTLRSVAIAFLLLALIGVGPLRFVGSAWALVDQSPKKKKEPHGKKPKHK